MSFFVYIVECADNTFYTGYTKDVLQRVTDHNNSKNGAKYTRARRPVRLVYKEKFTTLSEALVREYQVKRLSRKNKAKLVEANTLRRNY